MDQEIILKDLNPHNADEVCQAAQLLVICFAENSPQAWPNLESATQEALEACREGRICRAAFDRQGQLVGWIAGQSSYRGRVWELHPLAVHPQKQLRGIGKALVKDFEAQVQKRGGETIVLGTDDENGQTSLWGIELYPEVWQHLAAIRNLRRHPYEFYQKLGYHIVGVIPDANGRGKPEIWMAKRVSG